MSDIEKLRSFYRRILDWKYDKSVGKFILSVKKQPSSIEDISEAENYIGKE